MQSRIFPALAIAGLLVVAGLVALGSSPSAGPGVATPSIGESGPPANPAPPSAEVRVAPAYTTPSGVQDLGAVAPSTPFDVAVGLALQNPSGLAAYLTALDIPGTPAYHHFLSTSTLASQFGASPTSISLASTYFKSYGLEVAVSPDRLLLDVSGSAAEIGPAFGTEFDSYVTAAGHEFVSHPTAATLPGIVGWTGVLGLGNTTSVQPMVTPTSPLTTLVSPDATCAPGTYSSPSPLDPCQVWSAYNMTAPIDGGTNGTGETIGVVDTYDDQETQDELESDLASFDTEFEGPGPATVNYLYPVPSDIDVNTTDSQWGLEEALDLEWTHASAPGATIDMTFSPNSNVGLYQAIDYLVAHQSVNVLSLSWGEPDTGIYNAYSGPCLESCNASTDGSYALLGPVLEFAAAEGISVFAASGDCGAADGTSGLSTNYPSSDPYVTGVGGTYLSLSSTGAWAGETGWSGNGSGAVSPGCVNQGGSGGGYTPSPRPWWQTGEGLATGGADRGVPDVSAISVPGAYVYDRGEMGGVGGTSLATPIWAGIAAIADQYAGHSLGLLDPALYGILRGPEYSSDFHDIVTGNNTYLAGPGWDPVTGIGTPIVSALLPDLAAPPATLPTLQVQLNVSATSGRAPLVVTYSVDATGGSGDYPSEGVYFGDGNASFTTGGTVVHTYRAAGVYAAQAYIVDSSGNFSVSVPVAVVVGGSALQVVLGVSNTAPAVDVAVTLTPSVVGGTAPYTYFYWFGDGTYQNWTSASSLAHAYGADGSYCAEILVQDAGTPPDGGSSLPVPVAVGGAPAPVCELPPAPLVVTPDTSPGIRDAPADFPSLFQVSGGTGTLSEQYVSTDPYVAACGCTVFRSSGTDVVRLYVNQSGGSPVVGETNVTVAPELTVTFAASPTFGAAPLTVDFTSTVIGGYDADPAAVNWTFGNGQTAVGSSASETYVTAGIYEALGHLSDQGHGNASEAFLIDVGATTPSASPYLTATIAPAVDVLSGETVHFAANAYAHAGTPTPANFTWRIGGEVAAYSADVNRTYYAPSEEAGSFELAGNVTAFAPSAGASETAAFGLPSFFAVESGGFVPSADGLVLSDTGGPAVGSPPFVWTGNATTAGPGTTVLDWTFGDGTAGSGTRVYHVYSAAGEYSETVVATDSWGDRAVDAAGVEVTNGSAAPLELDATASVESGMAPLVVNFTAIAYYGAGSPYSYAWQFGDGSTASTANATHTYERAGNYTANVTTHDSHGSAVTRSFTIAVSASTPVQGPVFGFLPRSLSLALLVIVVGVVAGVVVVIATRRPRVP